MSKELSNFDIHLSTARNENKVLLNDIDITRGIQSIKIEGDSENIPTVTIVMMPEKVNISGIADVFKTYAKLN